MQLLHPTAGVFSLSLINPLDRTRIPILLITSRAGDKEMMVEDQGIPYAGQIKGISRHPDSPYEYDPKNCFDQKNL